MYTFLPAKSRSKWDIFSRPRMLLEYGNIILESSTDHNITFRARGRGAVNLHTESGQFSLGHQMTGFNSDLLSRIDSIETNIGANRVLADRLNSLEERVQEIAVSTVHFIRH